ncbi:nuclear fragile X mental retardation-interacting protein 1-like [Notechis scutatus]|uniref:Nuclear fragile X mental retardation-interacting protein 1-like n=1 Tax=Notechis scutatus TaxID=8663 RepID=A0A6J1VWT8_9SAUR|nr:nuclear fragile X mental retardation-interacting protein 1-like [Notechis scutatus]
MHSFIAQSFVLESSTPRGNAVTENDVVVLRNAPRSSNHSQSCEGQNRQETLRYPPNGATLGRSKAHSRNTRNQKRQKKTMRALPAHHPTLLEMLLAKDIRHERNVILQCIRYILQNDGLGFRLGSPSDAPSDSETTPERTQKSAAGQPCQLTRPLDLNPNKMQPREVGQSEEDVFSSPAGDEDVWESTEITHEDN